MFSCHRVNLYQSKKQAEPNTISYYDQLSLAAREERLLWPDACMSNNTRLLLNSIPHETNSLFDCEVFLSGLIANSDGQKSNKAFFYYSRAIPDDPQ